MHDVYKCALCNEQFAGEIRINQHFAEKHENSDDNSDSSDEEPNIEDVVETTDSDEEEPKFEDVMELPSDDYDSDCDGSSSGTEVGFSWQDSLISDRCFQTHPRVSLPPRVRTFASGAPSSSSTTPSGPWPGTRPSAPRPRPSSRLTRPRWSRPERRTRRRTTGWPTSRRPPAAATSSDDFCSYYN